MDWTSETAAFDSQQTAIWAAHRHGAKYITSLKKNQAFAGEHRLFMLYRGSRRGHEG